METYNEILEKIEKLKIEEDKLTKKLQRLCKHPHLSRQEGEQEHGWKVFCYRCLHCGKWWEYHTKQSHLDRKVNEHRYFFGLRRDDYIP